MRSPFSSPGVCGAALAGTDARCERPPRHTGLHQGTLRWSDPDEAPTERLPPIRESIGPRRRPPAIVARDLTPADRAELLRLMAAELEKDDGDQDDGDDGDDGDDPRELWAPCAAGVVNGRLCRWPETGHPCLGYGSEGCGMKAQER